MRALIDHRTWLMPVLWRVAAGDHTAPRGVVFFGEETRLPDSEIWIFTDLAAATLAAERGERLGAYCEATGIEAFWGLLSRTGGTVIVNPHSEAEQNAVIAGKGVAQLVVWARAIRIEEILGDGSASNMDILDEVLGHPSFLLARSSRDGEPIVSMGSHHRKGLHVFTSPDCWAQWVEDVCDPDDPGVKAEVLAGDLVFRLAYDAGCDMICFNSSGPGKGRDVALEQPRSRKAASPRPKRSSKKK